MDALIEKDDIIRKLTLHNAIKHKGRANPGAVMGAVFKEIPDAKKDAKLLARMVKAHVMFVNDLPLEKQIRILQKMDPSLLDVKKEKKKKDLPQLKKFEGSMVTRMPPEPSKYLHFGHALSFLINYMYAKKYDGKCVLRLDDTNPEKAKPEYYQAIYDDLLWLGISPDDTIIASKEMEKFYHYAQVLIEKEKAYVCFCDKDKMREMREKSMICDHREQNVRQTLEKWQDMLKGKYANGEAVLRLRADMDAANAVMRDPVLFRVSTAHHALQKEKYKVWPMYDFETVVAEDFSGITHIFRSNEFGTMRVELQDHLKDHLGFKKQDVVQYGRFSIKGGETKGRVIREKIEKGEVDGWDDPRLVTLQALRRRGIQPETFYELVLEAGLSPTETKMDWSVVASVNRKLIDDDTRRFFFVKNPKKVMVDHSMQGIEVPNHPSNKELGKRLMRLTKVFYVQDDLEKGKMYRFMHMFNFRDYHFHSEPYDASLKAKIIHAVPAEDAIDVQVLMSDGTLVKGKGEKALQDLEEGTVVQFERLFFCRLDNKEKMLFVYAHD